MGAVGVDGIAGVALNPVPRARGVGYEFVGGDVNGLCVVADVGFVRRRGGRGEVDYVELRLEGAAGLGRRRPYHF